jgi:hypothetical protein
LFPSFLQLPIFLVSHPVASADAGVNALQSKLNEHNAQNWKIN